MLNVGDLLQLTEKRQWLLDLEPWDCAGKYFTFPAGTVFEIVEFDESGDSRMWCPQFQNYVSGAVDREYLPYTLVKISK